MNVSEDQRSSTLRARYHAAPVLSGQGSLTRARFAVVSRPIPTDQRSRPPLLHAGKHAFQQMAPSSGKGDGHQVRGLTLVLRRKRVVKRGILLLSEGRRVRSSHGATATNCYRPVLRVTADKGGR